VTTTGSPSGEGGSRVAVAQAVAAAVDGVGGARRTVGSGVEVATQLRGGRVVGVRVVGSQVEVHVVVEGLDVARVAERVQLDVRAALDRMGDPRPVALTVDDIDLASIPARR
jgi:hypothetical protein